MMVLVPMAAVAIIVLIVLRLLANALSSIGGGGGGRGHGQGSPAGQPQGHGATPNGQPNSPQSADASRRKRDRKDKRRGDHDRAPVPVVPRDGFRDAAEEDRFEEHCRFSGYEYDRRTQTVRETPYQGSTGFGGFWGFCQMCFWVAALLTAFSLLPHN